MQGGSVRAKKKLEAMGVVVSDGRPGRWRIHGAEFLKMMQPLSGLGGINGRVTQGSDAKAVERRNLG